MLRTALKPRWIAFLILALAVTVLFAGLSKWQLDQSIAGGAPPREQTENPQPLNDILTPGEPLTENRLAQKVDIDGELNLENTVQVAGRENQDDVVGYWLVSSVTVADAPDEEAIPVAWAWMPEQLDLDAQTATQQLTELFESATGASADDVTGVMGRLVASEGPIPGTNSEVHPALAQSAATAELTNLWDEPMFAAVVTAESFYQGADEYHLTADATEDPAASAQLEGLEMPPPSQETEIVWMNVFYGIEWAVFGIFTLYLWWRFVRDDYLRDEREKALDIAWEAHWKAKELKRLREQAAREKAEAVAAYERYQREHNRQNDEDTND